MSEIYISLDAQGNGRVRCDEERMNETAAMPAIRAQMREVVAAYREKQIEQGLRRELRRAAMAGCWVGRIQGALFVATAVFLWWVGGKL